jgi:glutamine synthetase
MNTTANDVLRFIKENEVKFIRLGFCDLFGLQKNISIMPDELPGAFKHGISFDASAIRGFRDVRESDLLLFPDPATLTVLPWRPGPGRVVRFYCDIKNPDGSAFAHDSRCLLKKVVKRCESMGYVCKIGAECEFYLFKTDEDGEPMEIPLDKGGYLDISPLDKGENIRREICLCLEEMGISPEASHHEQGPGQNEIDFKYSDALTSADNLLTFKSVVKAIAARNGLFASFMPKPLLYAAGSGLHVNISLSQNGLNIFDDTVHEHSDIAKNFIAGILAKTPEISLFLNPLCNSYERFGSFEAPKYVSWSHQNRSQLVRIPAAIGERVRMELRSPDPSINPYLAFALIMAAGLEGIETNLALLPAVDVDLYAADDRVTKPLALLPDSLARAIELAENSPIVKAVIGEELLSRFIAFKKEESTAFAAAEDKAVFYKERYFGVF